MRGIERRFIQASPCFTKFTASTTAGQFARLFAIQLTLNEARRSQYIRLSPTCHFLTTPLQPVLRLTLF